jgi:hypothetical protein
MVFSSHFHKSQVVNKFVHMLVELFISVSQMQSLQRFTNFVISVDKCFRLSKFSKLLIIFLKVIHTLWTVQWIYSLVENILKKW